MADKDTVEKFLDNNPEFAKVYYEKKVKADVITAAFNNQVQVKDPASYKDLSTIQEAEFIFELIKEIQSSNPMEKILHKILQRIALLIQADRCSYFGCRARNGTPELSTILFDVTHNSPLEKNIVNPNVEIVFPTDMGVVGWTAHSKKPQNIPDVKKVKRKLLNLFEKNELIWWTFDWKNMLCFHLKHLAALLLRILISVTLWTNRPNTPQNA